MRSPSLLCGLLWAGSLRLHGAEPVLTHVHPAGVAQGTSSLVKLTGTFSPWPCQVWSDAPEIVFSPAGAVGTYMVMVGPHARTGPHLIRAFNAHGASAPISMAVASAPQILETEPNDDFRAPQELPGTTATCNGRLDKTDDVDSFLVRLRKGQNMVTWVEAYVLAAGFDSMLRVLDASGVTLAFNHDHTTMDPFLVFEAPSDGAYVVQTMGHKYPATSDVRFAGGDDCIYRLHVSMEPVVRNTWPLVVQRGVKTRVALEGWNLAASEVDVDGPSTPDVPVVFSDLPELTESAGPQMLEIPSAISGRIDPAGDEDRFSFAVAKDTVCELTVTGTRHGSVADAWLKVQDSEGKELASNDDDGTSSEPRIVWTAPADGTYTALVGELTRRGGTAFYYRLMISKAAPAAAGSVASHSIKLEPGKSAELKTVVTLTHGFQPKLKVLAKGLPAGVSAADIDVPEKGGEVTVTVTAEATAPPVSQPFQLVLRELESAKESPVLYSMASTSENNGVPQGYRQLLINSTDQLWLTLTAPPPPAEPKPAPAVGGP